MICLAYHRIDNDPADATAVTADVFRRQMRQITSRFRVVPLSADFQSRSNTELGLTFDDGWADNFSAAFPLLLEFKLSATIFVATGLVDRDPRYLTWSQIREMADAGVQFGGHTRTHVHLTQLDKASANREIAGCRKTLEDRLGQAVEWFSYPFSDLDRAAEERVLCAGFKYACLTAPATMRPSGVLPTLNRVGIYGTTSPSLFRMKVSPMGNWLIERSRGLGRLVRR